MMKNKWLYIILILSLGLNLGIFLRVGYHLLNKAASGNRLCGEYKWHTSPLSRKLNLNEEQTKTIQSYQKEMEIDSLAIRNGLSQKRQALMALIKSGTLDEKIVDTRVNDISSLQGQLEKKVIQHLIKIHKVLTPEQLAKFNNCFEQGFCPKGMNKMPCHDYMENKCAE